MRNEDRIRILHMIDATEAVAQFTEGRSRDDLDRDRMLALTNHERIGRSLIRSERDGDAGFHSLLDRLRISPIA
jgi:hypothetical protein